MSMWYSDNLTQNFYTLITYVMVLAIAGGAHLFKQYREKKKEEKEYKELLERQKKQYNEVYKKKIVSLHNDGKK